MDSIEERIAKQKEVLLELRRLLKEEKEKFTEFIFDKLKKNVEMNKIKKQEIDTKE